MRRFKLAGSVMCAVLLCANVAHARTKKAPEGGGGDPLIIRSLIGCEALTPAIEFWGAANVDEFNIRAGYDLGKLGVKQAESVSLTKYEMGRIGAEGEIGLNVTLGPDGKPAIVNGVLHINPTAWLVIMSDLAAQTGCSSTGVIGQDGQLSSCENICLSEVKINLGYASMEMAKKVAGVEGPFSEVLYDGTVKLVVNGATVSIPF